MKMFVYGDVDCRGHKVFHKGHLDTDHVSITIALAEEEKDEQLDDFFDTLNEEPNYRVDAMILLSESPNLIENLKLEEAVSVMGEEELYGIGLTKDLAKQGYLKGLGDAGEMEDEGDW